MPLPFHPIAWHPSTWELVILVVVILLLFGSRLPKVARSLGQGINMFKKGLSEGVNDKDPKANGEEPPPASPASPAPPTR